MPTSDKLPRTVATTASYVAGESPSATKLTLIGTQLRAAARNIESALGDLRGQRSPYITETAGAGEQPVQQAALDLVWGRNRTDGTVLTGADARSLDIVNLARIIGPASNLNPRSLDANDVEEPVPASVYEFALKYPVDIDLTGATDGRYPTTAIVGASTIAVDDTAMTTYVDDPAALDAAGEWTLDAVKGVVYSYSATAGDGTFTYPVDPAKFHGGYNYPGARFNVIPDPNADVTDVLERLAISGPVSGVYTVTLPVVQRQQSNESQDSVELTDGTTYADLNSGQQLKLPAFLDGLTAGTELPAGIVLLKHLPTNTVYTGGTYYYNSDTAFDIAGVTLPSTDGADYVVITAGNNITTAIDDLRIKSRHSHNRDFGEPLVHVRDLYGDHEISHGNLGRTVASSIAANYFPQYLQRGGFDMTEHSLNKWNSMAGAMRFLYDEIAAANDRGLRFAKSTYDDDSSEDITLSLQQDTGAVDAGLLELARVDGVGGLEDDFGEFRIRGDIRGNDFLLPLTYRNHIYLLPDERYDPGSVAPPGLWHSYIHSPGGSAVCSLITSGIISDKDGNSGFGGDETMVYPMMSVPHNAVYRVPFRAPTGSTITRIDVYFNITGPGTNYIHLYLNSINRNGGFAGVADPVERLAGSSTVSVPGTAIGKLNQSVVTQTMSVSADSDTLYAVEFANKTGDTLEVHYIRVRVESDSLVSMLGWEVV